jgi:hypothetical protein
MIEPSFTPHSLKYAYFELCIKHNVSTTFGVVKLIIKQNQTIRNATKP